jgi:serine/threonine protein kinase
VTNKAIKAIDLKVPGYKILSLLGKGAMAKVYLALQESLNREVALKVMAEDLSDSEDYSARFLREARIVAQLSHAHIVSIYDIDVYEGKHYLSMEYHPGGDLKQKIRGGLSIAEAITLTNQIASALDYAHRQGYVHRDVKPENILFDHDGKAILNDFGIAVSNEVKGRMTTVGTIIGSPKYMSPEQAKGEVADSRADIYSLGVIFYEMLTGTVPYNAENPVAICQMHVANPIPTLPAAMSQYQSIIDNCLAKDAKDRYSSAKDIIQALKSTKTGRNEDGDATVVKLATEVSNTNNDKTVVSATGDIPSKASSNVEKLPISTEESNSVPESTDQQSKNSVETDAQPSPDNSTKNQSIQWFIYTFVSVFSVAGLGVLFYKTDIIEDFLKSPQQNELADSSYKQKPHKPESSKPEAPKQSPKPQPPKPESPKSTSSVAKSSTLISSVSIITPNSQSLCATAEPYSLGRRIVTENDSLNRGECFSVQIETTDQFELIVFSHSEDGTIYRLIPNQCNAMGLSKKTFVAGETINIPLTSDNKIAAIGLDNKPGTEWIYVIAIKDAEIKQTILSDLHEVQEICITGPASTLKVASVQYQLEKWALKWPNQMQWVSKSFTHTAN